MRSRFIINIFYTRKYCLSRLAACIFSVVFAVSAGCCLVAMLYALFILEESLQLPPGERSSTVQYNTI